MWIDSAVVGGGIKAGVHHDATEEFGYKAVEDKVHVNDLHGLDHEKVTYRHNGRVIHEILA